MRKGVAVPYIIAILLGVAVIGLIGYQLFVSGGKLGTTAASQQCKTDFTQACNEWARVDHRGAIPQVGDFTTGSNCEKAVVKDTDRTAGFSEAEYKAACG